MKEISVILGSDSDISILNEIKSIFNIFEIEFDKRIISAHRTPEILTNYIKSSEENGVKVFIAAAGMSAALPGVVASLTTRPVIGVPAYKEGNPFTGMDSLLSIVQMPPGVPVATVSINGGKNAALLALRILSIENDGMRLKLLDYTVTQKKKVLEKDSKLNNMI